VFQFDAFARFAGHGDGQFNYIISFSATILISPAKYGRNFMKRKQGSGKQARGREKEIHLIFALHNGLPIQ